MSAPATGHDARSLAVRLRTRAWRIGKRLRQRIRPETCRQHVFVAGMQRSGTNLVMDVFDASLLTDVYHETDPRAFERYEMRPPVVIRALSRRSPAPVFVVKALCELERIRALMDEFVPARTLWVVRDWRDSVHSAIRSFGNFVPQWKRLVTGDSPDWRGRGMSAETRAMLARLYREEASEAEGAAMMWYYRNVLFFEQALETDPRVKVVFYEGLVQNPVEAVARIYDFVGLPGFSPRIAGRIYAHSVKHRAPEGVSPEVAAVCDALLARFSALSGSPV